MSIHIRTILKAVLMPASVLALSLTLPAGPALAQPATTVFASDPADMGDCADGATMPAIIGGLAGGLGGFAVGGPPGAGMGALAGSAVAGQLGCSTNVAIELSKE